MRVVSVLGLYFGYQAFKSNSSRPDDLQDDLCDMLLDVSTAPPLNFQADSLSTELAPTDKLILRLSLTLDPFQSERLPFPRVPSCARNWEQAFLALQCSECWRCSP